MSCQPEAGPNYVSARDTGSASRRSSTAGDSSLVSKTDIPAAVGAHSVPVGDNTAVPAKTMNARGAVIVIGWRKHGRERPYTTVRA